MSVFSFDCKVQGSVMLIHLSGSIDEHAELPEVELTGIKRIDIDFKDVEAINSLGVRTWISWMRFLSKDGIKLVYHQVPRCIIAQCSMVKGFLPKNGSVQTCAVPLYCEKCKKSIEISLETTFLETLENSDVSKEPFRRAICGEDACEVQLDFSIPKYLSVIRR